MMTALLVVLIGTAAASPLDHSQHLLETGDYAGAIELSRKFLAKKPDDPDAEGVRLVLDAASFGEAQAENTVSAYRGYRTAFPDGASAALALELEGRLAWAAVGQPTLQAIHAFLADYAQTGVARDTVAPLAEKLEFEAASALDTAAAWRAFLASPTTSARALEAADRLGAAAAREARTQGTIDALAAYLRDYPGGPERAEVATEILAGSLQLTSPCGGGCASIPAGTRLSASWAAVPGEDVAARLVGVRHGVEVPLETVLSTLQAPEGQVTALVGRFAGTTAEGSWTLDLPVRLELAPDPATIDAYAIAVGVKGQAPKLLPVPVTDHWRALPTTPGIRYKLGARTLFRMGTSPPVELPADAAIPGPAARVRSAERALPADGPVVPAALVKTVLSGGDMVFYEAVVKSTDGSAVGQLRRLAPGAPTPEACPVGAPVDGLLASARDAPVAAILASNQIQIVQASGTAMPPPRPLINLKPGTYQGVVAALSPDGKQMAAAIGSPLRVWIIDVASGKVVHQAKPVPAFQQVEELRWSDEGPVCVTAAAGPTRPEVHGCWDPTTTSVQSVTPEDYSAILEGRPRPTSIRPSDRSLITHDLGGTLELFVLVQKTQSAQRITNTAGIHPSANCTSGEGDDLECVPLNELAATWLPGLRWIAVRVLRDGWADVNDNVYESKEGPLYLASADGKVFKVADPSYGQGFPDWLFRNCTPDGSCLAPNGARFGADGKVSPGISGASDAAWYQPDLATWLQ